MHTIKEGEVRYKKHEVDLPQDLILKINHRFQWVNSLAFGGDENVPQHMRPQEGYIPN
jgi:hypothetical protein